jgi:LysM repeat protein
MSSTYAARPQQSSTRRTGTTARRQRLTGLEITTLVVIAALLLAGAVAVRPHAPAASSTQAVQVQAGETLWSIARAHPVPGLSTAQAVETIARDNGLADAHLSAGQTLVVPADAERVPQMASR